MNATSEQTTQTTGALSERLDSLDRLVERVRRRVTLQVGLDRAITAACVSVMLAMVGLVLWKTHWIEFSGFTWSTLALASLPLAAFASAWFDERDPISLAQRVDQSHELHDRLSTAVALARSGDHDEFTEAQMRDALAHTGDVDLERAAPFSKPRDLSLFAAFLACFGVLVLVQPPSHTHPLPDPPVIKHDPVLDSATLAMEKEQIEEMKENLEGTDDPETKEIVDEIEKLLEDVEERKISGDEFLDRIDEIEREHFEKPDDTDELADAADESLSEELKRAAEKLEEEAGEELEKEADLKEAMESLEEENIEEASKSLEKLAEKLDGEDIDPERLERLAEMMKKFSDNLDVDNEKLRKMMEKHRDLAEKLSEKMKNQDGGLSQGEKRRLDQAKKKAEQAKEKLDSQKSSEKQRRLEQLRRKTKEASEKMQEKAEKRRQKESEEGEKGEKKAEKKKDSEYENEAGRKTKETAEQMEKESKKQKSEKTKQMARKQLEELRRSMERSRPQQGESDSGEGSNSESSGDKGEKMREFIRRAQGSKDSERSGERGKEGGSKGESKGDSEAQDGARAGKKPGEKGDQGRKKGKSRSSDKQGDQTSDAPGDQPGGPALGEETSNPDSERKDSKVSGRKGEGPSKSQVIRSASEKGFANREYKDVYGDYSSVVEEVMEREDVPPGYRYYVKRYFELIKPRD